MLALDPIHDGHVNDPHRPTCHAGNTSVMVAVADNVVKTPVRE